MCYPRVFSAREVLISPFYLRYFERYSYFCFEIAYFDLGGEGQRPYFMQFYKVDKFQSHPTTYLNLKYIVIFVLKMHDLTSDLEGEIQGQN